MVPVGAFCFRSLFWRRRGALADGDSSHMAEYLGGEDRDIEWLEHYFHLWVEFSYGEGPVIGEGGMKMRMRAWIVGIVLTGLVASGASGETQKKLIHFGWDMQSPAALAENCLLYTSPSPRDS